MIETFLFLVVYTGIIGATGFLMGRVFYRDEKQLRKIGATSAPPRTQHPPSKPLRQ
jgi:hypothetical protein